MSAIDMVWSAVAAKNPLDPCLIKAGNDVVLECHPWDVNGMSKINAMVALHNHHLKKKILDQAIASQCLQDLPSGNWKVKKSQLLFPAAVTQEDGNYAVFILNFRREANQIAQHLVDLHDHALAKTNELVTV